MRWTRIWVVLTAFAGLVAATSGSAGAAGAAMTLTGVRFQPSADKSCSVPEPDKSGKGSGAFVASDNAWAAAWEWTVPAKLAADGAGATGSIKATVQANTKAGFGASIKITAPSETGISAGPYQVDAVVDKGETGTDSKTGSFTFKPPREFTAGETLSIIIGFGCANVIYDYTAAATSSASKTVAAPAPGKVATVKGPPSRKLKVKGDLTKKSVVAEGGTQELSDSRGSRIAACWLIGPEEIAGDDAELRQILSGDWLKTAYASLEHDPKLVLGFCKRLVSELVRRDVLRVASTAAVGCNSRRIAIAPKVRKGKIRGFRFSGHKTPVRYSCVGDPEGIDITVKGKVGKTLDLGLVTHSDAPAAAESVTFDFG